MPKYRLQPTWVRSAPFGARPNDGGEFCAGGSRSNILETADPCYEPEGNFWDSGMREDVRHYARREARRERGAWAYLLLTTVMFVGIVAAFLWWTW